MTRISNKREFLGRSLQGLGLLRLLEAVGRKPCLAVLTYHRIVNPAETPYYRPVCSASPETFTKQVDTLRDNFRVVTLGEVARLAESGFPLKEPTALITFDDGYRDNFETAFPILKKLGLPATFFLPTAFLQSPRLFWWDHVALALNQTKHSTVELSWPERVAIDLAKTSRDDAIAQIIQVYRRHHLTGAAEERFRQHLDDCTGVAINPRALAQDLFMTREQVRELADSGMSIGSHAHSHVELAQLPEPEQRDEFARSKAILESDLGREVEAIAYPYGWPGACDATTERLAAETGYKVAFAAVEGLNRPGQTNRFAVKRFGIGFGDSPNLVRSRLALHAALGKSIL